ncbi:LOW QUALITY PROTEIN: hypothetical protein HID58_035009, partial [Brassica napus]
NLTGFRNPSGFFGIIIGVSILVSVPAYEHMCLLKNVTKKLFGITMLLRIGDGMVLSSFNMVLSSFNMVLAALVKARRLQRVREHRLMDKPDVTVTFVTQYLLGMIDVFSLVGTQEFFYDQVLTEPRSIGLAPSLSAMGLSSF